MPAVPGRRRQRTGLARVERKWYAARDSNPEPAG
jgi:hypothetical protein